MLKSFKKQKKNCFKKIHKFSQKKIPVMLTIELISKKNHMLIVDDEN